MKAELKKYIFLGLMIGYVLVLKPYAFGQASAQKAEDLFQQQDYERALEIYQDLLKVYPKDPTYNYYAGRCLFELNQELEVAREHLYIAVSSVGPDDALFYYAKVSHLLYYLDDAQNSLLQFDNKIGFLKKLNYNVDDLSDAIKNTQILTKSYVTIGIESKQELTFKDAVRAYNSKATGYQLKSPTSSVYLEYGLNDPPNTLNLQTEEKSDRRFVTAGKKIGLAGTDIYELGYDEEFQANTADPLDNVINTKKNENYAWWDNDNQYLYFSSEGHNTMGGHDIFRSRFNAEFGTWSSPENLGFPMNTPYDDFLLPGNKPDEFYLISNRNTGGDAVELINLRLEDASQTILTANGTENLKKLSNFDYTFSVSSQETVEKEEIPKEETKEEISKIKEEPATNVELRYNQVLDEALALQLKADSLYRLSEEKRQTMLNKSDRLTREKLRNEIKQLETQATEVQEAADKNFMIAREIEQNDMLVNNFPNTEETKDENPRLTAQVIKERLSGSSTVNSSNQSLLNNFEIRTYSPYDNSNPIPMDYNLPEGLLYRIQLGVFSKNVPMDKFGGITPITGDVLPQNGYKKFYAGLFSKFENAEDALYQLKAMGYKDAYIVSWFNGKKVSVNRAEEIEKSLY